MQKGQQPGTIISVGGGKGGVGKSILSIALGTVLARSGESVVLADLDLGAANLHTYLGILQRTPTIADFILNKIPTLESLVIETPERNLGLISGAEFVPGATNPAHWMKMKLLRHLRTLPAEYVIIDLGAGVHFNTLDFFGISDSGVVITAPEPGAVMNAYSFVKGALFRKMQNVFRNQPKMAALIDAEIKGGEGDKRFTLEWFKEALTRTAPDLLPVLGEIEASFTPALVINRVPEGQTHLLVENLIHLCTDKLGITLEHVGDLPEARELTNHLLNVPKFFDRPEGAAYFSAVHGIVDEERDELLRFMDTLDDQVFDKNSKNAWKLRMFFKPSHVVGYLISRGVKHDLFYRSR
jgi:flagellar biosynthesis protein FlhG